MLEAKDRAGAGLAQASQLFLVKVAMQDGCLAVGIFDSVQVNVTCCRLDTPAESVSRARTGNVVSVGKSERLRAVLGRDGRRPLMVYVASPGRCGTLFLSELARRLRTRETERERSFQRSKSQRVLSRQKWRSLRARRCGRPEATRRAPPASQRVICARGRRSANERERRV